MATGIVADTVNVAHGLCFMALTTTKPSTAIRMIIMLNVPINAAVPPKAPNSSRAICPKLLASRRVDKNKVTMSCTQPPNTAPNNIHNVPGR